MGQSHAFGTDSQYFYHIFSRLDVASDVISDVAVDEVSLDAYVKCGDSRLTRP